MKYFALVIFVTGVLSGIYACEKKVEEVKTMSSNADTCEGPDVSPECCFIDFPSDAGNIMTIADDSEPGERIIIKGVLIEEDTKRPIAGAKIYAYHTDKNGYYPKNGDETGPRKWQGRLYGYCITDSEGRYEIHTIKPGSYPEGGAPAHIHWYIKIKNEPAFYLNDFVFSGDKLVTEDYLSRLRSPGDKGLIELKQEGEILVGYRTTPL